MGMRYFADVSRHLVCIPYSEENLHEMAKDLEIKKCWFHKSVYNHYDIPKRRLKEILEDSRVNVVSSREILKICKGEFV
jgi:hypothetical protein